MRASERPSLRQLCPGQTQNQASFSLRFPPISHRFPRVAAVTQALQVVRVGEARPVSLVIHDVVNVSRPDPVAALGTFPAEGLPKELPRPEVFRPDVQAVPPVPLG